MKTDNILKDVDYTNKFHYFLTSAENFADLFACRMKRENLFVFKDINSS